MIELSYLGKLREVKEVITLYGRSVNLENKDFRNERYSVYQLFAELSHVVQERAEGPKAPSPGRALKKSPFLRTKTEKGYDL